MKKFTTISLIILQFLLLFLIAAPITETISRAGQPQIDGKSNVMTWAELYGHAAVFRARSVFPESHVTVETGLPGLGGWTGEKENEIVRVEFRKRESKEAGPLYLFSPWQRLAWKGTGVGHPGIVTVTKHLIVLRSIDNGEQSNAQKDFTLRSMRVIEDLMMTNLCEQGTRVEPLPLIPIPDIGYKRTRNAPIYRFRPHYFWLSYTDNPGTKIPYRATYSWGELVQSRMLLVTRMKQDPRAPGDVITYDFFPPARVNRTRPFPIDPAEQRLSPDTDLEAEGRKLDRGLRRVFADALTRVLSNSDGADHAFCLEVYNGSSPGRTTHFET